MFSQNIDPEKYINDNNLLIIENNSLVLDTILNVLSDNPEIVKDFKCGNQKVLQFLIGQSMKALHGKANPVKISEIIKDQLLK